MVRIDEDDQTTIRLTRGDSTSGYNNKVCFTAPYYDKATGTIELQEIQVNDKISFVVYEKSGYTKQEVLRKEYKLKDFGYGKATKYPELILTSDDTKRFPLTNKPVTYWYDIVLNDEKTIIGYDENGAKKIVVYPEAEEG